MANAAIETYDLGDTARAEELFVESWARGIHADRPTPALEYYVGGVAMAAPEMMRDMIEVRRGWTEAELRGGRRLAGGSFAFDVGARQHGAPAGRARARARVGRPGLRTRACSPEILRRSRPRCCPSEWHASSMTPTVRSGRSSSALSCTGRARRLRGHKRRSIKARSSTPAAASDREASTQLVEAIESLRLRGRSGGARRRVRLRDRDPRDARSDRSRDRRAGLGTRRRASSAARDVPCRPIASRPTCVRCARPSVRSDSPSCSRSARACRTTRSSTTSSPHWPTRDHSRRVPRTNEVRRNARFRRFACAGSRHRCRGRA